MPMLNSSNDLIRDRPNLSEEWNLPGPFVPWTTESAHLANIGLAILQSPPGGTEFQQPGPRRSAPRTLRSHFTADFAIHTLPRNPSDPGMLFVLGYIQQQGSHVRDMRCEEKTIIAHPSRKRWARRTCLLCTLDQRKSEFEGRVLSALSFRRGPFCSNGG